MNCITPEAFTLFVAVFAATLAAVNIFNSHLANPFFVKPVDLKIGIFKAKYKSVRNGLSLPFARERLDKCNAIMSVVYWVLKGVVFFYNIVVLCSWGYYSLCLLLGRFSKDDAYIFLSLVSILSLFVVIVGIVTIIIAQSCMVSLNKIKDDDRKNLKAANTTNEQLLNQNTASENIS